MLKDKILNFYDELSKVDIKLPNGFKLINPYNG